MIAVVRKLGGIFATGAFFALLGTPVREPAGDTSRALAERINTAIAEGKIPGAVLLIGNAGQTVFRQAFGSRSLVPDKEPMTADTVFDCASLTKVVATTSSVMRLFEEGKIQIDARVTDYLPEFQNGKSEITIRDLMTHHSGLRPDLDLEPAWSGYETGIRRALGDAPQSPRATKFVYSDINFILMGEIVRRVGGLPLDEFARKNIFAPLGMTHTTFRPPPDWRPQIAPTERLKTGEILRGVVDDPTSRFMGGVAGHAGMFSTADDLGIFCQMLLGGGINPRADATHPARLFNPLTIQLFTSAESPAGSTAVRGLGWDINTSFSGSRGELFPVGSSFGHTGFTGTSLWIDPTSQTYVVLLTNAIHPAIGKPITPLRKSIATIAAAQWGSPRNTGGGNVQTGLDVAEAERFRSLAGKRVGLITNTTGIDRNGLRNLDVMRGAGVNVTALFSPEHGIASTEDRPDIGDSRDRATGLRVWSLFGATKRPTPEMLRDIDVMVFDIADVGVRFYTYTTTMAYAMEACAKAGKPFIVFDRPNPITGLHVEGPVLTRSEESFIGYFPMAVRHGMTGGELAQMFNAENHIGADLTVVQLVGWRRAQWFDETGLPWVDPSPNIRSLTAALLYPALALLEGSENYSVGRGTSSPFEWIGAKWIAGRSLAEYLNGRGIPAVRAYPVHFRPEANHFSGERIEGVRFSVTDRDRLDVGRFGIEVAAGLQRLYPGRIRFDVNRKLIGDPEIADQLGKGVGAETILTREQPALDRFRELRGKYLLYR